MAETKRSVGRPTDYRPEFCKTVVDDEAIRKAGATDTAIATALDVDAATVWRWKDQHPDFKAAVDEAKRIADDKVKQSLFARATGYDNPNAVKIFMPQGARDPVYAPFTEHYPPDVGAAFNWLKNRQPHEWRDRVEHTGADGGPVVPVADPLEIARTIALALEIASRRLAAGDGAKVIDVRPEPNLPDGGPIQKPNAKRGEKP